MTECETSARRVCGDRMGSRPRVLPALLRLPYLAADTWRKSNGLRAGQRPGGRRPSVRIYASELCPRQDSNLRSRLRRPLLSPLSYGGSGLRKVTSPDGHAGPPGTARYDRAVVGSRWSPRRPCGTARGCRGEGRAVGTAGPPFPDHRSAFPARSVAGSAGKTLLSRPWRRDWDACSSWTTMR